MTNRRSVATAALLLAAAIAGCGASAGSNAVAPPPPSPTTPVKGTLRMFTYADTVVPALLSPFKAANPALSVESATFASDQEAAAKLAGGFQADVVEVCLDEMQPLLARKLLRPINTAGITDWNQLEPVFAKAPGVVQGGKTYIVPLSSGPHGLIYNTKVFPHGVSSYAALFDPSLKGRVALDAGGTLTAIGDTALALGYRNPMSLTNAEVAKVGAYLQAHHDQFRAYASTDADSVNLMKSGEVVLMDGGRGTAQAMQADGVPVKWVGPSGSTVSWVCGLAITNQAANLPAAYRVINYYLSPRAQAINAAQGYVVTNKRALPLVPVQYRATADPSSIARTIPESEPANFANYERVFQAVLAGG
jgi:spermidine/putrescine-binding protein